VLDPKPCKESRQDESDEPAFLARQPEHLANILPQEARASKPMQSLSLCAIMRP